MINVVFSWRCKCGARVKVLGETDAANPTAKSTVKCPGCNDPQTLVVSKVVSVVQEEDESLRAKA
jgi:hypothetical protein